MLQTLLALAIFLLLLVPALAGTNRLKLICHYPDHSDQEGVHHVTDDLSLTFIIDLDEGAAYMIEETGSTQIQAQRQRQFDPQSGIVEEHLAFIEVTPSGNVITATVVDDKGNSVHRRNTLVMGELVPTQYHGTCMGVARRNAPQ